MAEFKLSGDAGGDLQHIWWYTFVNWSEIQADKYIRMLRNSCQKLAENPALGRKYKQIPAPYLGYKSEKHILFYKIVSSEEIVIVRILHENMDFERQLEED